jgi:hypothetical protein
MRGDGVDKIESRGVNLGLRGVIAEQKIRIETISRRESLSEMTALLDHGPFAGLRRWRDQLPGGEAR